MLEKPMKIPTPVLFFFQKSAPIRFRGKIRPTVFVHMPCAYIAEPRSTVG